VNLSPIVSIPGNRWRVVSRASAVSLSAPAKRPLFNWTRRRAPRGERKPAHRHTAEDRSDLQIEALVEACSLALASSREPGDVSISISHHLPTGRELSFTRQPFRRCLWTRVQQPPRSVEQIAAGQGDRGRSQRNSDCAGDQADARHESKPIAYADHIWHKRF